MESGTVCRLCNFERRLPPFVRVGQTVSQEGNIYKYSLWPASIILYCSILCCHLLFIYIRNGQIAIVPCSTCLRVQWRFDVLFNIPNQYNSTSTPFNYFDSLSFGQSSFVYFSLYFDYVLPPFISAFCVPLFHLDVSVVPSYGKYFKYIIFIIWFRSTKYNLKMQSLWLAFPATLLQWSVGQGATAVATTVAATRQAGRIAHNNTIVSW